MKEYLAPYKKYLVWAVIFNLLSAVLNIFSFASLIPMLRMLFNIDSTSYQFMEWDSDHSIKDLCINNFYYYTSTLINTYGASLTLLFLGLFLAFATLLKTGAYFGSAAIMIPLRTGVVRDIRVKVYKKVVNLPLAFFSEEKKGDIIARMSGDVTEIETSITSSIEMLIKNPILIIIYFATLVFISWQLTLFTITVLPLMGWLMGAIGKKLKQQSLTAQNKWSETMTQMEETLGGLRIIKAFIAERKMINRFEQCSNEFRDASNLVAIRQSSAHPVSEFLGTCLIVLVLWFGGTLIFSNHSSIDAPTFIFYMVILYSIINPLKDLSKASYNIPKGLASMERINKILNAENYHEYYIIENRQNIGWDTYIGRGTDQRKRHGMMVSHVDYSISRWRYNNINTTADHQCFTIIPADGELYSYTLIETDADRNHWALSADADLFPGSLGVTCLFSGVQPVYTSAGTMHQPITGIVEHPDGTISLTICQFADINGDGLADSQDVLKVYDFMQEQTIVEPLIPQDVNGDGVVDTQDVLLIYENF